MITCWYYWLYMPLRNGLRDSPDALPAFEIDIQARRHRYKLALFLDERGTPAYGRLGIFDLPDRQLPEDSLPTIQMLKEHLLSVLRVTTDAALAHWDHAIWLFTEDGQHPNANVAIEEFTENATVNPTAVASTFSSTLPMREELRLLTDSEDRRIPLQYRYLSVYKILELRFSVRGTWRDDDLGDLVRRTGVTLSTAEIHTMRQKCAHIKTRQKKAPSGEVIGVTHLNQRDAIRCEAMLLSMRAICVGLINECAEDGFMIGVTADSSPSEVDASQPSVVVAP
ncbi:MAG: hypothetical protein ACYDCQ_15130 [Dehalococcoidia bacterium]